MASESLDPYNIPFAGVTGSELARARLRFLKRELRENPGVNKRYVQAGVREFLPGMKKIIDGIPQGTSLIVMPSTSGVNRIPAMLARSIKRVRPDLEIINSKEDLIKVSHVTESKIKDRFIDRLSDHRTFTINDKILAKREQLNRSSLIIDDSISTGDSAIILQRQLLQKGIYARGIVAAVAGGKYHTRISDVDRLFEKLKDHRAKGYSENDLKLDIQKSFIGYPNAKLKRLELGLLRKGQLFQRPDLAVHYIRTTAAHLTKERLTPNQMLEAKELLTQTGRVRRMEPRKAESKGPKI